MNALIIFGVFAALLFGGVYLTKRHFGVLGLALVAGSVLAGLWGTAGGLLFESEGIDAGPLSSKNLAVIILTLLPAGFLLLRGPKYHTVTPRIGASLLFTFLALALVISSLQPLLITNETTKAIYVNILQYRELIISAGLAVAFVEIFFTKTSASHKSGSKH